MGLAIRGEKIDRERSGPVAAHPGRSRRHAREGDAPGVRTLRPQTGDGLQRDMALDHVRAQPGRVAAPHGFRNSPLPFQWRQVIPFDHMNGHALIPEIADIFATASTVRGAVNRHHFP